MTINVLLVNTQLGATSQHVFDHGGRLEIQCYRTGISWFEAQTSIFQAAAVRVYLAQPLYPRNCVIPNL